MKAIGKSDVGITRKNNEDFYVLSDENRLFVVADGMGGHNAGEIASKLACESIVRIIDEKLKQGQFSWDEDVEAVISTVNASILDYVKENPNCRGMGTTLVMAYFRNDCLYLINIGDSRCYGLNDTKMLQLTKDHSLVAELVKMGTITQEEALTHPDRNIITSALGVSQSYEIHKAVYDANSFQKLLICTDGLTNMVDVETVESLMRTEAFDSIPERLIDIANQNGGKDNITVVCVEI